MRRSWLLPVLLAVCCASSPVHAAGSLSCRLEYRLTGWSAAYRTARGTGVVTCDGGQRLQVRISARGGGLDANRTRVDGGRGRFAGVGHIRDVIGGYAAAGAPESAGKQVMAKGAISLALTAREGDAAGPVFGSFVIAER